MSVKILAIGDLTVDLILGPLERAPVWGQEVEVASIETRLGGNIGNFAVAGKLLGLDLVCVGPIGADRDGEWIKTEIGSLGYSVAYIQAIQGGTTSQTIALVRADGERTFITYPGVLATLSSLIQEAALPPAEVAIFSGWCQPPRVAVSILVDRFRALRAAGTSVVMDLCWLAESWSQAETLVEVLKAVDIVLMNQDELTALTGIEDPNDALSELSRILGGRSTIVVKRGAAGAIGCMSAGAITAAEAPAITVRGAVGAGDCFNAALIDAMFNQRAGFVEALRFATSFASQELSTGRGAARSRVELGPQAKYSAGRPQKETVR
jgi:sugar/nucleoside kinase (ribokinase family)